MAKLTKRRKEIEALINRHDAYAISDAVKALQSCAKAKFKERFDVAIRLGVDARKSDQAVRGATVLPHGTGKTVRVAVFAQGENADKAKAAGADIVGFEDLAERVKKGEMDFDVVIATPDSMRVVGQLGTILGPRGLMPNPKVGTVSADVETAVKNAKGGQVRYRTEKNGIIHCTVGAVDFSAEAIAENIEALLADLKKAKPASAKGTYFKKLVLSTTMGPGLQVDFSSLTVK